MPNQLRHQYSKNKVIGVAKSNEKCWHSKKVLGLRWTYGLFINDKRVSTVFKFYFTVTGIINASLK